MNPEPKRLVRWKVPYESQIDPGKLDEYFGQLPPFDGTLADLLLNNEATAVYHVDPAQVELFEEERTAKYLLLGVNYHTGHSEGHHKIVVQDIPNRRGPWVLFRPPGSDETTFYLQDLVFPRLYKPEFVEVVENPGKIEDNFLHRGDPLDVFRQFKERGFDFVDEPMPEEKYEHLQELSIQARGK